jgi:Fe-S cluster assembly scaffold protein SufB
LIDDTTVSGLMTHRLVFADGILVPQLSRCDDLPEGVVITGLGNMLQTDPARLEGTFGEVLREPTHGFNAMNSAFVFDGAFVEIGSGVVMDRPLELLFISAAGGEGMLGLPRNLVLLRAGSQATLYERYISATPTRSLTSVVSEVLLEENAKLHLGRLLEESKRSFHIGGLFAEVGRNACLTTNVVTLGGALVRNDLAVNLNAEVDTMPQLEIYADDVKCAHGASVGQLEEDAVFYMRSRGLGEMKARQMLTQAFAADVLEEIEPPPLREYLQGRIDRLMKVSE